MNNFSARHPGLRLNARRQPVPSRSPVAAKRWTRDDALRYGSYLGSYYGSYAGALARSKNKQKRAPSYLPIPYRPRKKDAGDFGFGESSEHGDFGFGESSEQRLEWPDWNDDVVNVERKLASRFLKPSGHNSPSRSLRIRSLAAERFAHGPVAKGRKRNPAARVSRRRIRPSAPFQSLPIRNILRERTTLSLSDLSPVRDWVKVSDSDLNWLLGKLAELAEKVERNGGDTNELPDLPPNMIAQLTPEEILQLPSEVIPYLRGGVNYREIKY